MRGTATYSRVDTVPKNLFLNLVVVNNYDCCFHYLKLPQMSKKEEGEDDFNKVQQKW